jgi:hypothetical protein
LCEFNLLGEAHQEHIGPLGDPFLVQLLLGRRALHIVRRLEALQKSRERRVDLGGKDGHIRGLRVVDEGSGPGERR